MDTSSNRLLHLREESRSAASAALKTPEVVKALQDAFAAAWLDGYQAGSTAAYRDAQEILTAAAPKKP